LDGVEEKVTELAGSGKLPPLVPQSLAGLDERAAAQQPRGLTKLAEQEGVVRAPARQPHEVGASHNVGDIVLQILTRAAAALIIVTAVAMVVILVVQSWSAITHFGISFITSSNWAPPTSFGALPAIQGTLYTSIVALLMAGPVGVLIAIFLSEMSPRSLRFPIGFLVELLAAVPSIIYGLWALFVLVPIMLNYVLPWLSQHFGFFPLFASPSPTGQSYLTACLILSVMILPTIAAISRDVVMAVPQSQREGMLALGATKWETIWKVVIPYARTGIIGGIILGLGRAIGETMAVQMVVGGAQTTGFSILSLGTTMPANIVSQFGEATPGLFTGALLELALILLLIVIVVNTIARLLVWGVTRKYAQ
jgi:phosphate transport system permease protein